MEYRGDISPLFDSGWSVKTQNWKIEFNRGKSLRMSSLSAFFFYKEELIIRSFSYTTNFITISMYAEV